MNRKRPRILLILIILLLILAAVLLIFEYFRRSPGENREPGRVENEVAEILRNMSLEEKIGQVIVAYFSGPDFSPALAEELRELPLGGVILFSGAGNIESPAQVASLTEQIQRAAIDRGMVPLFIAVDQEGGAVARLTEGVTVFPGNMALGATGSEELARKSAAVTARELRILGINFNFAPVVDVNNNPDNPVIGVRSFGSDPHEVARLGRAMVVPYRHEKVIATAKHFPGHGDTDVDSHYGLPLIPYGLSRLRELELLPFQAMIDAGVPAVMLAHILVPGLTGSDELPASLSPQAVRHLREEMGFDGLVVSDSMSMGAISGRWGLEEAAVMAFRAGVDLILFGPWIGVEPGDRRRIFAALKEAVDAGAITLERLDQSVKRILAAKKEYGILDDPLPRRGNLSSLASPENLELARRIARESITLVRDRASLIPLSPRETIPLIWPVELESALAPLIEECPFLQPRLLPFNATGDEIEEVLNSLRPSALVLVGTSNLRRRPAWIGLLNTLAEETELVLLALSSPYDLLAVPRAGACLCTYSHTGVSLQALAEVLKGALAPRGRLPVELPGLD
ncbi:MAG: glycoside hydrolase family 3 protein [Firmicutes bacterium]|nr:glycoside hydrolase family 3 protein [Bacillota bacterium]